jgi:hypothetical protein
MEINTTQGVSMSINTMTKSLLTALVAVGMFSAKSFAADGPAWMNKINLGGDFRYRFNQQSDNGVTPNQSQFFRARLALGANVNDMVSANFRLATVGTTAYSGMVSYGSPSANPVTGIPTGSAGRVTTTFDLAFLEFKFVPGLILNAGKMSSMFWSATSVDSQIIFGGDMTFDGWAAKYMMEAGDFTPYINVGYSQVREAYSYSTTTGLGSAAPDSNFVGFQLGSKWKMSDLSANVAVAQYLFPTKNELPSNLFPATNTNTLVGGVYEKDTKLTAIDFNFGWMMANMPFTIYALLSTNSEAADFKTASIFGLTVGKTKDAGSWSVDLNLRDVKKDALLSGLTDVTFAGGYKTDLTGTKLSVSYVPMQNLTTSIYYSTAQVVAGRVAGAATTPDATKFDRIYLQADASF